MKTIIKHLILIALIAAISIQLTAEKKIRKKLRQVLKFGAGDTPKGIDLSNHYGTKSIGGPFANQNQNANYIESHVDDFLPQNNPPFKKALKDLEFKPFPGYQERLNPGPIKSGEFTNVAPTARNLVDPDIAPPKLRVDATVNYPALADVPTYRGFINKFEDIKIYDRETGRIEDDRVSVSRPWLVNEKKVYYILNVILGYSSRKIIQSLY
jgi:hypothetical protein